jgi:hypothetical protein
MSALPAPHQPPDHEELRRRDERDAWRHSRVLRRLEEARVAALAAAAWLLVIGLAVSLMSDAPDNVLQAITTLLKSLVN